MGTGSSGIYELSLVMTDLISPSHFGFSPHFSFMTSPFLLDLGMLDSACLSHATLVS
jgi:hypothetical protein